MSANPLEWTAAPFLLLYLALGAALLLAGLVARQRLDGPVVASPPLTEFELAYLAGGASRVADVALYALVSAGQAEIDARSRIRVATWGALNARLGAAPALDGPPNMSRARFQTAIRPIVDILKDRMRRRGYAPSQTALAVLRSRFGAGLAALLIFGGVRAIHGVERGHPIGFLLILMLALALLGARVLQGPRRSRAGKSAVEELRLRHARAARAPLPGEFALAIALSGPIVLAGTPFDSIRVAAASQGASGGGDAGGGCSGGGGGCGGCGS